MVDYGQIRLQVKQADVRRLELFTAQARANGINPHDKKRLDEELSHAHLSATATVDALRRAGVEDVL